MEASPPVSVPGSDPAAYFYPEFLGFGSVSPLQAHEPGEDLPEPRPIGFVHFPDPEPE